jgi:hypothetical protein
MGFALLQNESAPSEIGPALPEIEFALLHARFALREMESAPE